MNLEGVKVNIGGIRCGLISRNEALRLALRERYAAFVSDASVQCDYHIVLMDTEERLSAREPLVNRTNYGFAIDTGQFYAIIDLDKHYAEVSLGMELSGVDEFLKYFYAAVFPGASGMLLRALAVAYRDKGYVFCGGRDKCESLIAGLAFEKEGVEVLSDHLALARERKGVFWLYPTPFCEQGRGVLGGNKVPLDGVFFLNQDLESVTRPIIRAEAIVRLMESSFYFRNDFESARLVFERGYQFVSQFSGFEANLQGQDSLGRFIDAAQQEPEPTSAGSPS